MNSILLSYFLLRIIISQVFQEKFVHGITCFKQNSKTGKFTNAVEKSFIQFEQTTKYSSSESRKFIKKYQQVKLFKFMVIC